MQEQKDSITSQNVGRNLRSLLEQTGITIVGLAHGVDISTNHARLIKKGKASISSKTAGKIADFFHIETGKLFLSQPIKLKDPLKIPPIEKFYNENIQNSTFFIDKSRENSVTYILKTKIIFDCIMDTWIRSKDIVEYVNQSEKYKKHKDMFNIKIVSKALGRIYEDTDLLERDDLRRNGKVFVYRRRKELNY